MITTTQIVRDIIKARPLLEDLLIDGLLNVSALARSIMPEVQEKAWKETTQAAIVMALQRLADELKHSATHKPLKLEGTITVKPRHAKKYTAITIHFEHDTTYTPGVYYRVLKALAWENVNFIEIISKQDELTFILENDVADVAFSALRKVIV